MRFLLLFALFAGLMADGVFGWGLGLGFGLSLKNTLLYVLALSLGIEAAVSGRRLSIELPQLHILFVALLLIAVLSWTYFAMLGSSAAFSSTAGLASLKGNILDHYLFFLVFFLGLRTTDDVLRLQRWILLMIASGNVVTLMDAYNLPDLSLIKTRPDGRVTGPLGEANQYGVFLAMFFPILIAKVWTEAGLWRAAFTIGAGATFWVLLLTVSRGAFVAVVAGSLISSYLLRRVVTAKYVRRVALLVVAGCVAGAVVLGQQYIDLIMERTVRTAEVGDAYAMTSGRTWIWSKAIEATLENPLTVLSGHGLNTFRPTFGIAPHSVYFGYLFELGVFGVIVFVFLLMSVVRCALRAVRRQADTGQGSRLLPEIIGFVFGYIAMAIGIAAVDLDVPWYFIWAYTGVAMRLAVIAMNEAECAR